MEKIRIGVSTCLLGQKVRYDGGHKHEPCLTHTLGRYVDWLPICPESECGLGIPREAMRLTGDPLHPRLKTIHSHVDHTDRMLRWARAKLDELAHKSLSGFVFKSMSPSSGLHAIQVYTDSGVPRGRGVGLFARSFTTRFPLIPVEDEIRLRDAALRENFFIRAFTFRRWEQLLARDRSLAGLVEFHTCHKLLLLSHSPAHYRTLGRLVASAKDSHEDIHRQYATILMEGLRLISTERKNTNVLLHMIGYFKKQLSTVEKQEFLETVEEYRAGDIPLVAPLSLIRHYTRKYEEPYLAAQVYLFPDPTELMLRNHA